VVNVWLVASVTSATASSMATTDSMSMAVGPFASLAAHSLPVTSVFVGIGALNARILSSSLDHTCKVLYRSLLCIALHCIAPLQPACVLNVDWLISLLPLLMLLVDLGSWNQGCALLGDLSRSHLTSNTRQCRDGHVCRQHNRSDLYDGPHCPFIRCLTSCRCLGYFDLFVHEFPLLRPSLQWPHVCAISELASGTPLAVSLSLTPLTSPCLYDHPLQQRNLGTADIRRWYSVGLLFSGYNCPSLAYCQWAISARVHTASAYVVSVSEPHSR
jgi:hypothetical protein